MCPECGATETRVINASHDPEGNRIRRRECEVCAHKFPTVEVPFPFSFHEADADKREAPAYSSRIKVPEYEPSYFVAERVTLRRHTLKRKTLHANGRLESRIDGRVTIADPDPEGDVLLVRLKRSSKLPRCRKGLHVMRGANVYHHPRGQNACNACRREAANARYRNAMEKMPQSIRDELNARSAERKRQRVREKAAAEGREVQTKYTIRYATDEERREARRKSSREAKRRAAQRRAA